MPRARETQRGEGGLFLLAGGGEGGGGFGVEGGAGVVAFVLFVEDAEEAPFVEDLAGGG